MAEIGLICLLLMGAAALDIVARRGRPAPSGATRLERPRVEPRAISASRGLRPRAGIAGLSSSAALPGQRTSHHGVISGETCVLLRYSPLDWSSTTTVSVAWVAHSLMPGFPWASALILGAIVSPPDAIAATAVLQRMKIPRRASSPDANLLKGASGQAVQNLNVMLGLDQRTARAAVTAHVSASVASVSFAPSVSFVGRVPEMSERALVLKLGGELLEDRNAGWTAVVGAVAAVAAKPGTPLVMVHGGGKEIDAALKASGPREAPGRRPPHHGRSDARRVVVSVLAGAVNTRLVAALNVAGVAAVGLTGADAAGCRRRLRPTVRWTGASSISDGLASRNAMPTCAFCRR